MRLVRVLGLVFLSVVDALIPTVVAALAAFFFAVDPLVEAADPLVIAAGAGACAFVGTLTVGLAANLLGYGAFPATRATKWLYRQWTRPLLR
jgi:hypothetical protein